MEERLERQLDAAGLWRVADYQEICDLSYRYSHASDQKDYELLSEIFTPDGALAFVDEWSDPGNDGLTVYRGTEGLRTMPKPPLPRGLHVATNVHVLLADEPDDATGLVSYVRLMAHDEGEYRIGSVGLYRDRYRRTSAGWRIAYREIRRLPPGGAPISWFSPPEWRNSQEHSGEQPDSE